MLAIAARTSALRRPIIVKIAGLIIVVAARFVCLRKLVWAVDPRILSKTNVNFPFPRSPKIS
jgi:hypothetical protein